MDMAMSDYPWRHALGIICSCLLRWLRLASRPARLVATLVSLVRPACSCRGAGSSGVRVHCCPPWSASCRREGVALRGSLLRSNEAAGMMRRCVDYVNCLSSVDWHGCRGVYSISCLIDGASADFVGFLGRCLISPGKACGCFAPARSRVFSFLRDGGGDFFSTPSINTYSGATLLTCSSIAIE